MPYLELTIYAAPEDQDKLESTLDDLGALAVTLMDADLNTADEQAILEPGVNETPLWRHVVSLALFEADVDPLAMLSALAAEHPGLDITRIRLREVADQDWERAWMNRYQPMRFGERLWIYPWNINPVVSDDEVVLRLDPGLAFGTGTHPTTALCLEWLEATPLHGDSVLDFGSGSGVLAIASLLLGAESAMAVDNDPQAILASRDNAERNGVGTKLLVALPEDVPAATPCFPVVVANILANALDALAERLASLTAPGGRIALSGILDGQQQALLERYATWFEDLDCTLKDGWVRIDGRRRQGVS
ncbi:MAG: 50S ribosomal protein L11 methyltransferase [Xanthomonadales bacterium]|nr:50S ribosomal protein L11 methyltransferase [Xanthomonadales bacterium]